MSPAPPAPPAPPARPGHPEHRALAWERAAQVARDGVQPVAATTVPLHLALGAVLAQDALARTDLPATDTAAMDGWAVAGPPPWRLVGEVLAGTLPPPLGPGAALGIATGAAMPAGAEAVLRQEWGRRDGDLLHPADAAGAPPERPRDIRRAGTECRRGDAVLAAGTTVTPAGVGLLAAAGLDVVTVRRAAATVLVLGDELLGSGPARDGRVRDALGPLLAAWLPAIGLAVTALGRVPDRRDALTAAITSAAGDVVVTTGSTARGPVDHLHDVLAELGARLVVDGVAVRPGHPQLLAVLPDGRPLIGLPGNPLAAVSGLLTLLGPVARALHGAAEPAIRTGTLAVDVGAGGEATRLLPVRDGHPVMYAGPAMLRGLATAVDLAVVPPGGVVAGGRVQLLGLPGTG